MKKILAMAFIALTTLSACTGNDDDSETTGVILVRKVTQIDGDTTGTSTYTYDGTKLKRIAYSSGAYQNVTYTGELPTTLEHYENGGLDYKMVLAYDDLGKLKTTLDYEMDPSGGSIEYFTKTKYTYNADGTISTISYNDEAGTNIVDTATLTIVNGNIVKKNYSAGVVDYTFDNKTNPFGNIKGYNAIALASMEGGVNNILTSAFNGDTTPTVYTLTYNDAGYPLTITELYDGTSTVQKYTY